MAESSSQTYANWLDPCFPLAWDQLQVFEWILEERPERFRVREVRDGKAHFLITSDGWVEAGRRLNLRWTRIQGAALDIATLMCYPTNRPDLLPVYAFEWVLVGGRGHAMICDVEACQKQPALERALDLKFKTLGDSYSNIFSGNEKPQWFQEICRPHAQFFSASLDELTTVFRLQQDYLGGTLSEFYIPLVLGDLEGGEDHPDTLTYKIHHSEHSPGKKLLAKTLGQTDAELFLDKYHFGPSQGIGTGTMGR